MTREIANIYLAWRRGAGSRRVIIGKIKRTAHDLSFSYYQKGLELARAQGLEGSYTDFPETDSIYKTNVLEIFGQRLNKSEREDISKYYDYWEINPSYKDDKYYLLAHTQGLLPTDNFEFLADYNPVRGLSFISELCGLTHLKLLKDTISEGDILTWKREPTNEQDKYAVKVYKGSTFVGYVKRVHSRVFYKKLRGELKITVKSVNKNGHINRAFITISQD